MKIIGGVVSYEDGVKTVAGDQFSPTRKVRVELNFSLDDAEEGDDTPILGVLNKAQAFVQDKLGIEAPTAAVKRGPGRPPKAEKSVAEQHEANLAAVAESSKATARVMSDKEKLAAAAGVIEVGKHHVGAALPADPAAMEDEDPLADLSGGPTPEPVTDAALNAAVQARNKAIKNPIAIREVVARFNGGPGKVLADIPQDKRHLFLKELEALK